MSQTNHKYERGKKKEKNIKQRKQEGINLKYRKPYWQVESDGD
jgi:hypothetical protein